MDIFNAGAGMVGFTHFVQMIFATLRAGVVFHNPITSSAFESLHENSSIKNSIKSGKDYRVSDKIILFTRTYSQFRFSFIAYPLYVVTPPCAGFTPCKLKQCGVNRNLDFFHDFRHRFLSVWAQ
jgi:hypothetical protein